MNKQKYFLIWTVQRTGSTSLSNILQTITGQKILHEPFNSNRLLAYNNDEEVFLLQLEKLRSDSICFKHCWNVHSLQVNQSILDVTIDESYKILLLYRKNNLAREISRQLAKKTGIWGHGSLSSNQVDIEQNLSSFNIKQMKKSMDIYLDELKKYRNYLIANHSCFLEISYEDLFEGTLEKRLKNLNIITGFLDICSDGKNQNKINDWLMNYKQNTEKEYSKISNLKEIMDTLSEYEDIAIA
jgi:LPS sulfotransferase NodH